jgi:4-diphosphocytidyl-2-C-methyl-D-erythritol kinase
MTPTGFLAWPAPAKLNLFLHVTGRRADGYHALETVFRFLDYGDMVYLRGREDAQIRRVRALPGVAEELDLSVRAARLLQQRAGVKQGVDLWVEKRLPLGGGLGGGSSDAATVLLALNRIWGLDWPRERLADLSLALGADCPVFVQGRAAFARGVGEQLSPIELPPAWYVVLIPRVQVSTREIFAAPELTRNTPPVKIADFSVGACRNDLQDVVVARYPEVARALAWLGGHGPARMTGSGACVYLPCADESTAKAVFAQRPAEFEGFVARGLDRHPVGESLA